MKPSSGLLLGVLFTLVVVIIAVVIYFNTRPEEEKPQTSNDPSPSPGPSPTLPTISDLIIAQTFSPDGNEPYTIEPYTIEPYTPSDIIGLSKNVNFTLEWTNGSGFIESGVSQIKVFHIVESWSSLNGGTWVTKEVLRNTSASTSNFGQSSVSISGLSEGETAADGETGPYSFVGKNFFKIVAVMPTGTANVILYDGQSNDVDENRITDDDLVGTIDMATPETITFTPRLDSTVGQTIGKSISSKRYDFYYYETPTAESATLIFSNVRLVPMDINGTTFKLEKSDDKFFKGIKVMQTSSSGGRTGTEGALGSITKDASFNTLYFKVDKSSPLTSSVDNYSILRDFVFIRKINHSSSSVDTVDTETDPAAGVWRLQYDTAGVNLKLLGSYTVGGSEDGSEVTLFEFNNDSSSPMIVHISESTETDEKGHDKVIMLKQIINGEDYYLFGDHFDLLDSKTNSDDFFRRNIYITERT